MSVDDRGEESITRLVARADKAVEEDEVARLELGGIRTNGCNATDCGRAGDYWHWKWVLALPIVDIPDVANRVCSEHSKNGTAFRWPRRRYGLHGRPFAPFCDDQGLHFLGKLVGCHFDGVLRDEC